jgi:hypothetical protein
MLRKREEWGAELTNHPSSWRVQEGPRGSENLMLHASNWTNWYLCLCYCNKLMTLFQSTWCFMLQTEQIDIYVCVIVISWWLSFRALDVYFVWDTNFTEIEFSLSPKIDSKLLWSNYYLMSALTSWCCLSIAVVWLLGAVAARRNGQATALLQLGAACAAASC